MYEIKTTKKVDKILEKHKDIARNFVIKLDILKFSPISNNRLDIKKLKSEQNKYRLRIGKYRFLYEIIDDKILIFFYDANSRGDIY